MPVLVMAGLPKPPINSANPTLNVLVRMENEAKSPYTIQSTSKALTYLSRHVDLNQPEQIKAFIARHQSSTGYKKNLCLAYNRYCLYYKMAWQIPNYETEQRLIKIPTKEKLEMLIANAGIKMATKLKISLECGLRPIELINLKVKDIDLEQRIIYPTTAKHGTPRALRISMTLQNMISDHIIRNHLTPNDKLFNTTARGYSKMFRVTRNALAAKLHDPTIQQIRLYDFRHFFATDLYHKTRDILLVKTQLGHKRIENTLIYTQLLNLNDNEWTCKAAKDFNEATQLIEAGFEYVQQIDGISLYRKRK